MGLIVLPMILFGQEPAIPPVRWGEGFSNPTLWLSSFAGVSLLIAFVTTFFNGVFKVEQKFLRQLMAWIIAIIILVLGDVFNIKIVYTWDFPIWLALIHGFAAGLASNGWFDIPRLKAILNKIEELFVKE